MYDVIGFKVFHVLRRGEENENRNLRYRKYSMRSRGKAWGTWNVRLWTMPNEINATERCFCEAAASAVVIHWVVWPGEFLSLANSSTESSNENGYMMNLFLILVILLIEKLIKTMHKILFFRTLLFFRAWLLKLCMQIKEYYRIDFIGSLQLFDFSARQNVELEFRRGEFFVKWILRKSIVMIRIDLRLLEIVQAIELAAVNGSQDRGRRSALNIIF